MIPIQDYSFRTMLGNQMNEEFNLAFPSRPLANFIRRNKIQIDQNEQNSKIRNRSPQLYKESPRDIGSMRNQRIKSPMRDITMYRYYQESRRTSNQWNDDSIQELRIHSQNQKNTRGTPTRTGANLNLNWKQNLNLNSSIDKLAETQFKLNTNERELADGMHIHSPIPEQKGKQNITLFSSQNQFKPCFNPIKKIYSPITKNQVISRLLQSYNPQKAIVSQTNSPSPRNCMTANPYILPNKRPLTMVTLNQQIDEILSLNLRNYPQKKDQTFENKANITLFDEKQSSEEFFPYREQQHNTNQRQPKNGDILKMKNLKKHLMEGSKPLRNQIKISRFQNFEKIKTQMDDNYSRCRTVNERHRDSKHHNWPFSNTPLSSYQFTQENLNENYQLREIRGGISRQKKNSDNFCDFIQKNINKVLNEESLLLRNKMNFSVNYELGFTGMRKENEKLQSFLNNSIVGQTMKEESAGSIQGSSSLIQDSKSDRQRQPEKPENQIIQDLLDCSQDSSNIQLPVLNKQKHHRAHKKKKKAPVSSNIQDIDLLGDIKLSKQEKTQVKKKFGQSPYRNRSTSPHSPKTGKKMSEKINLQED